MADDTAPLDTDPTTGEAVATLPEDGKLKQTVEIRDAGPCKKHVKVTIDRQQIDERMDEKFTELVRSDQPQVRGFRPGKAPRRLIEKQYGDTVREEVKNQVLLASLEQIANEQLITPLSPPNLDPSAVKLPETGPLVYEFEIEVRPEFELPEYKGLKLRRPVHTFTEDEVRAEKRRLLEPYGQLVPKDPPVAALNDTVVANVTISFRGKAINTIKEVRVKVEQRLVLADGVVEDFAAKMVGAKPGDVREVEIVLGQELKTPELRGQRVQATFHILDVKTTRLPELTRELLEERFGVTNEEQLDEYVRSLLERRLEYIQRQEARKQVLERIAAAATWELPQDLLRRQARVALQRRVIEMKNAGLSDEQILARRRLLEQDVLRSTAAALKEHFVLQKIAEVEKIEIGDEDIDREIERIADQTGESPRRVRARYEKEDLMDALAADLLERRALDLILAHATYEDYEWKPQAETEAAATVEAEVVPGSAVRPEPSDRTEPSEAPEGR